MVFWDNLLRYPRFFISSMIGLILILLTPVINQLKNFNWKLTTFLFLTGIVVILYILKEILSID